MKRFFRNIAGYSLIIPIIFFTGRCNVQPKEHKADIGHFFTVEFHYFDTVSDRIAEAKAQAIYRAKVTDRKIQEIRDQRINAIVNPTIGEIEPYNQ